MRTVRTVLVLASLFVTQISFAGGLRSISKLANSAEVQKLEQEVNAQGGRVIGVMEDINALVPGSTRYSLFYSDGAGQIHEIKNLNISAGPVGGVQ